MIYFIYIYAYINESGSTISKQKVSWFQKVRTFHVTDQSNVVRKRLIKNIFFPSSLGNKLIWTSFWVRIPLFRIVCMFIFWENSYILIILNKKMKKYTEKAVHIIFLCDNKFLIDKYNRLYICTHMIKYCRKHIFWKFNTQCFSKCKEVNQIFFWIT